MYNKGTKSKEDKTMAKSKNGYYFWCEDGYHGWAMGMSATEKRAMQREHGKLVSWIHA